MADADLAAILRLRRLWDARATGRTLPAAADAEQADLVSRLHALDADATGLDAEPGFVQRLEDQLMAQPLGAGRPMVIQGGRQDAPALPVQMRWQSSVISAASVAALLTLVLIGALVIFRQPTGNVPNEISAVWSPADIQMDVPSPDECRVEPAPREYVTPGGTPSTTSIIQVSSAQTFKSRQVIALADVPIGKPADSDTVEAVRSTLREFVACSNAGDYARTTALYSPDAWRRHTQKFVDWEFSWGNVQDDTTAIAPKDFLPGFLVADVQDLADGRVSALVTRPFDNYGVPAEPDVGLVEPLGLFILAWDGNRLLVDERGEIEDADAMVITYSGSGDALTPFELAKSPGRPALLFFRNETTAMISLEVGLANASVSTLQAPPLAVATLTLRDLAPGTYSLTVQPADNTFPTQVGNLAVASAEAPFLSQPIRLTPNDVQPSEIEVPANEPATLTVENRARDRLRLTILATDVDVQLEPGEVRRIEVTAAPGTYQIQVRPAAQPSVDTTGRLVVK